VSFRRRARIRDRGSRMSDPLRRLQRPGLQSSIPTLELQGRASSARSRQRRRHHGQDLNRQRLPDPAWKAITSCQILPERKCALIRRPERDRLGMQLSEHAARSKRGHSAGIVPNATWATSIIGFEIADQRNVTVAGPRQELGRARSGQSAPVPTRSAGFRLIREHPVQAK